MTNLGNSTCDLAGHEGGTTTRRLVVEQDAIAGKHAVRFAVVDHDPVRVLLGHTVRRTRIKGRILRLRNLTHFAVQFRSGSLVEAGEVGETARADGVEEAQCAHTVNLGSIFRHLK